MKVGIKLLRVAHVPADQLKVSVGAKQEDNWAVVVDLLREKFGPLSPSIKFFKRDESMVLASVEAVAFDIDVNTSTQTTSPQVPIAGFVNADPIDSAKIHRLDGQLFGELARIGIYTQPENYEWRCFVL